MAKRKKNHKAKIKKWTSRHTHIVNTLARFNVVTVENLKRSTTVANKQMGENAFLDMVDLGYITLGKVEYKGELVEIATIGPKAERMVRDISSPTTKNIYNSSSTAHDLEHSNFIFSLANDGILSIEEIQNNYRSEKELKNRGLDTSVTDGAFIYEDERENIYIETATQHYSKEQRQSHERYANGIGRYIENCVRVPKKSL